MVAAAKRRRWASAAVAKARPEPRLKLVKAADDPAVEQYLNRKCVEGCIALREGRGETFRKPKSKDQPHHVLDELDVMLSRGEITRPQFDAGKRYGTMYRQAHHLQTYKCALGNFAVSARGASHSIQDIVADRVAWLSDLQRVRRRAFGDVPPRLVKLCDDLCGNDYLVDGGKAARARAVEVVSWLLTRLAYAYGILWWRDDTA